MSSNSNETILFSKYDLNSSLNKQVESDATKLVFSEKGYWDSCQSIYNEDTHSYPCTTSETGLISSYSSNNTISYTSYPYVYDSNSNLYPIINAYVEKLSDKVGVTIEGRLISYQEVVNLNNNIKKSSSGSYWIGSVHSYNGVWIYSNTYGIYSGMNFDGDIRYFSSGIRPVIVVPTIDL